MVNLHDQLVGALNLAARGRELAEQVAELLSSGRAVRLDFASVQRMTPSFSNAFVMVLLERIPIDVVRAKLQMVNRPPNVAEAMDRSALRFFRGIRLTSQAQRAAHISQQHEPVKVQ